MNKNQKLIQELRRRSDDDFRRGDVHQAIMNIMYDEWNARENELRSYGDMVSWFHIEYGNLAAFAVLIGKYNQQVCNGGHVQYFDNGYSSSNHCGLRYRYDTYKLGQDDIHHKLIQLLRNLRYNENEIGMNVLSILEDFSVSKYKKYDDDEEDYEICIEVEGSDDLDKRYYKISKNWMKFLNDSFTSTLSIEIQ